MLSKDSLKESGGIPGLNKQALTLHCCSTGPVNITSKEQGSGQLFLPAMYQRASSEFEIDSEPELTRHKETTIIVIKYVN